MSVKIVHAADFHLDSAFGALSAEQARQRRRESRELLTRLSNYVNQNGVDLVLLAGDLFDSDTTYRETLEALSEALGTMQARVFIAPGNHDPYSAKSPYATLSWPENVHVFTSKTVERVELSELRCAVYGAAFTAPVQDESLLAGFRAPEDDFIHLMVLHGDISAAESRYDPLTKGQIKESGIDYLALGHTHQFGGFLREGQTTYAYSGCPEGRGFDELGEKGILTGTVERGKAELSFVPFVRRRYEVLNVDVTGRSAEDALRAACRMRLCAIFTALFSPERRMSAGLISSRSKSSLRPTSSTWSCAMRRALARTSGRERRRIRCAACSCVSCARNSMLHPRTTSARRSASPRASALPRSMGVICEEEKYVDLVQPAEKRRKVSVPRSGGEVRVLLCRASLQRAQPYARRGRRGGESAPPLSQN